MTNRHWQGFIGIEAGIAIAIVVALIIAAFAGYHTYHASMSADVAATTTPVEATSTTSADATSSMPIVSPAHPIPPHGGVTIVATTSPLIIIAADSGKTVHLHTGDTFILKLGTNLIWRDIVVSDPSVIGSVATFAAIPDAQGMYVAKAAGTATITATGAPNCKATEMCPQYLVAFGVTIVVD